MRMISGSKFISSKDGKNPKTKRDVHVKVGQTFVIAHGSCQFVTDLVNNCFHIANKIKGFINPIDLLNHAYLETKVPGSSTACIITLNEWCLHAVNMGDNGFILLRNEEILYESPVQQHTYKTPYQLGKANDSPEEIKLTELEPGDIIIAGSAGLFNNLFTHEIKDLVINEIRKDPAPSPDMIAAEIAKNATERSIDKCRFTPYSKAAWLAGKRHKGGKIGEMNMIKVSNTMGIEPKPFDPKMYVEEDTFVTDESGSKKRMRLENNIVRWRNVKNPDGTTSYESNARFVRWSDGSLQLLIGNEVLDISVQDAQHDQSHLFLRHGKGILQSQGRILRKMRFMPSSLSSNSHRLLTALVDSRHKKVYKIKNCITDIDPEREKEEKEKAVSQTIRANQLLNRKREKVNRKYTQTVDRGRQLSPGFLEEALDETWTKALGMGSPETLIGHSLSTVQQDDEPDYHDSHRHRRRFEDDLEMDTQAEKRIFNVKKGHKDIPHKSSLSAIKSSRRPVDFSDSEREESEYESDGEEDERSFSRKRAEEPEEEYAEEEEEEDEHDEEEAEANEESEEVEEPKQKGKEYAKRKGIESDEDSPPRKSASHRRMAFVYDSDEE